MTCQTVGWRDPWATDGPEVIDTRCKDGHMVNPCFRAAVWHPELKWNRPAPGGVGDAKLTQQIHATEGQNDQRADTH